MNIREQIEELEAQILHPKAALSRLSKGRQKKEPEGELRTCFQRDRDRIIHSKSFRRLKHKTQVFLAPMGDHYRTRLTHVLEVSQIARTISRALRLNEDLTEAIALAHDLGHTPFGHAGEQFMMEIHSGGFKHYEQSLRVVDVLEKKGRGLNLTHEVRDGILKHSKGKGEIFPKGTSDRAETLEGQVVRVSDIIAYLNHDLDDALRARVLKKSDLPAFIPKVLGKSHSARINTMVNDFISTSLDRELEELGMSGDIWDAMIALRDFLFERVYEDATTKGEFRKARKILEDLYHYYMEHPEDVFREFPQDKKEQVDIRQMVCDFIAGMTDRFAIETYNELFIPKQWGVY